MATQNVWQDFDALRHNIRTYTVDKLKNVIIGMNEECGSHFSKAGKKQELIERIGNALDGYKLNGLDDKWVKAKQILYQVRHTGNYTSSRMTASLPGPSSAHAPYNAGAAAAKPAYSAQLPNLSSYNAYAPPRKPALTGSVSAPVKVAVGQRPPLQFKESPFFRIDQSVSTVAECPESTSATDRRQSSVMFSLTGDQVNKLKPQGTKYQLRLFCTSSSFYSPNSSFRTNTTPALIEFPPTCEVRVNNVQLTANLKGLKKKPGTAPPPDLSKFVRVNSSQNRVEMVYVNSQQPVQPKKYYLIVLLVEMTSVDELVRTVQQNCYKTSSNVQQQMRASLAEDDDIVAGPQKMSLKCPLMFTRVGLPCRSSKCVHPQCFDASAWFAVNEQTSTWLCPVCERVLDTKDLIIDGYFDEILKQTPDSVEDVMVEADGQWHTSDNKYGSASWRATHPPTTAPAASSSARPAATKTPPQSPPKAVNGSSNVNGKAKANNVEILVLDSDDEDENRVKRELSPSFAPGSSQSQSISRHSSQIDDVIDLTLDSDDEQPPPPRPTAKRKADEAEMSGVPETWKKGKMDIDQLTTPMNHPNEYPHSYQTPNDQTRVLPPLPPRFNSSYSAGPLPPHGYEGNPGTTNHRVPPLSPNAMYRLNGTSQSSWR